MAPAWCHRILNSSAYHITIIIVTIANALVICTIRFKHTSDQKPREYFFQVERDVSESMKMSPNESLRLVT